MKTSLFDFILPDSLIAQTPASPRDAGRMLVVHEGLQDRLIADLPQFLKAGDVMVFNDTKVLPARLWGRRGESKIEILLHKTLNGNRWQCFAKPAKKLKNSDIIYFADDFHAVVEDKLPSGEIVLAFADETQTLRQKLMRYGHMPLPPYIARNRAADASDSEHYQTLYARHEGSVAAPTAGLHFTQRLLDAIDAIGVARVYVTLHVGGGTFLPVKAENISEHVMHSEYATIHQETADIINAAKKEGRRVIAVGTTSLRTLESAADEKGMLTPYHQETAIFITPGYRFKIVDMLLTNFHLPRSTLFMLVCAFCGIDAAKSAYNHAISHHYRFYSYGDACLFFLHQ